MTAPDRLPFTGDDDADRYLVTDPFALLVGFELDQQVTVQKAFSGPWELRRRLGHLDPARIAATEPEELAAIFRERPALHRFPGAMAERVQALARTIADEYGGDASRVWREARDGRDGALPTLRWSSSPWWRRFFAASSRGRSAFPAASAAGRRRARCSFRGPCASTRSPIPSRRRRRRA